MTMSILMILVLLLAVFINFTKAKEEELKEEQEEQYKECFSNFIKSFATPITNLGDLEGISIIEKINDNELIILGNYDHTDTNRIFLANININEGEILWNKVIRGSYYNSPIRPHILYPENIIQTKDLGYLIVGTINLINEQPDLMLIKLSECGDIEWTTMLGDKWSDFGINAVERKCKNGGFMVLGTTGSWGTGGYDTFLVQVTSTGKFEWAKTTGTSSSERFSNKKQPNLIHSCSECGYFVTGVTAGGGIGSVDTWLYQLFDGVVTWSKFFGGIQMDHILEIIKTSDCGIIGVGYSNSFTPEEGIFVIKVSLAGNLEWAKVYGGDIAESEGNSIIETTDGNYFLTGYSFQYDGNKKMIIMKLSSNGNVLWTQTFSGVGIGSSACSGYKIIESNDGDIVITGYERNDIIPLSSLFVAKISQNGDKEVRNCKIISKLTNVHCENDFVIQNVNLKEIDITSNITFIDANLEATEVTSSEVIANYSQCYFKIDGELLDLVEVDSKSTCNRCKDGWSQSSFPVCNVFNCSCNDNSFCTGPNVCTCNDGFSEDSQCEQCQNEFCFDSSMSNCINKCEMLNSLESQIDSKTNEIIESSVDIIGKIENLEKEIGEIKELLKSMKVIINSKVSSEDFSVATSLYFVFFVIFAISVILIAVCLILYFVLKNKKKKETDISIILKEQQEKNEQN